MTRSAANILTSLEQAKERFDQSSEAHKVDLLADISKLRFRSASELMRFHELLCFVRAYPDGPAILRRVEKLLANFDQRPDLKKHSEHLVNTGISGTRIDYSFYWVTADWLTRKWPAALQIDWDESFEQSHKLHAVLRSLLPFSESILLDESGFSPRDWVDQVRGPGETDAAFLVRRFRRMRAREATREMLYEELDIPMSIIPGRSTPSRTRARYGHSPIVWQTRPRSQKRPVLKTDVRRAPQKVTLMSRKEGSRLIDLARRSMVTRSREVEAFANADRDDVMLVDCGQGLQLAGMGTIAERRHILETVYIFLILKNGMPIGYVQAAVLFGSAEVNFNVFETFRGGDAGWVYGRALSAMHELMQVNCFVLDPYQVGGDGNTEGLKSGAWWFYYKMGFRPRDREIRQLGLDEARKVKKNRRYRTPMSVLRRLGDAEMYLYLDRKRDDVLSVFPLENLGLQVTRMLAERFGSDREAGIAVCIREASELLGQHSLRGLNKAQRQAWSWWSPLVVLLPDIVGWETHEKSALAAMITAKGSHCELEYLRQFDRHKRLRHSLGQLAHMPVGS